MTNMAADEDAEVDLYADMVAGPAPAAAGPTYEEVRAA